jgi:hypothetical protein
MCKCDFQYKPKATIMLNSNVDIVGIMKNNQYQMHKKLYGYKVRFNGLKYFKACFFDIRQDVEI